MSAGDGKQVGVVEDGPETICVAGGIAHLLFVCFLLLGAACIFSVPMYLGYRSGSIDTVTVITGFGLFWFIYIFVAWSVLAQRLAKTRVVVTWEREMFRIRSEKKAGFWGVKRWQCVFPRDAVFMLHRYRKHTPQGELIQYMVLSKSSNEEHDKVYLEVFQPLTKRSGLRLCKDLSLRMSRVKER